MYGKKELYIAIFFYTKGGSLMNSTFASSYELLLSAISELELQKDSFVLHPGVDFSPSVIDLIVKGTGKPLTVTSAVA